MAQGKIARLPKLGEIKLPVHLMTYDDKENSKKQFHSNFAFWWAADGNSTVTDDDGNEIGMIGGKMGGHVEMSRYYPHNGKNFESGKYKQWASVIIDIRDIWDQIEALMESSDVKVQLDGLEEVQEKYQAMMKKEKEQKEKADKKLEEIKQMQKEAEEAEKKAQEEKERKKEARIAKALLKKQKLEPEIILKPGDDGYEGSKWDLEKRFGTVHGTYMIKETEIYENGNWDLTESLNARDVDFYEQMEEEGPISNRDSKGKIPLNIGCNTLFCDTRYDNKKMNYTDSKNQGDYYSEVSLKITSYVGVSPGAIHSYGTLNFNMPRVHPEGQPDTSTTVFDLPLFDSGKIQLTRILEEWEFNQYKGTYKGWRPGDSYSGFYKEEDIIERAKQVFNDLFGEGWKLKVEDY